MREIGCADNRWGDKRYYSLNYFLRKKYGEKVFKISLDAGFSCPNRDGNISTGGCIFCSSRGSGDFSGDRSFSITEQFVSRKALMKAKWKSGKLIAYFQAFSNTYASVDILRKKYEEAINQEGVVALAIATRPDCLGEDILELIEEYSKRIYTWVELGLQTSNDYTAKLINRGYNLNIFDEAIINLKNRNIDTVVHIIFGLPSESESDMLNTIKYVAAKGVKGVKLHLLHLMKETPLVKLYEEGKLKLLTKESYVNLICVALTLLPKDTVIHRLTGDSPRELLIGPKWSLTKWEILNAIDQKMEQANLCQGLYYSTN